VRQVGQPRLLSGPHSTLALEPRPSAAGPASIFTQNGTAAIPLPSLPNAWRVPASEDAGPKRKSRGAGASTKGPLHIPMGHTFRPRLPHVGASICWALRRLRSFGSTATCPTPAVQRDILTQWGLARRERKLFHGRPPQANWPSKSPSAHGPWQPGISSASCCQDPGSAVPAIIYAPARKTAADAGRRS